MRTADRDRQLRRWALTGAGVLSVAVLGAATWLVTTGFVARSHLESAVPAVQQLEEQIRGGEANAAASTLAGLRRETGRARDITDDPVWSAAAAVPFIGDDLRAVTDAAAVVDDVATRALGPAVQAASAFGPQALRPQAGRIPLEPIQQAAPLLRQAADETARGRDRAQAIDTDSVLDRIANPVRQLQTHLASAASTANTAANAAQLLPEMLGASDERTYLLMFQNNAELRATGGIPAAFAMVTANQGALALSDQASSGDFPRFPEPVLPLTPEQEAIYSRRLGLYIQDVNFTPDFPTSAQLAREMWRRVRGTSVDGVLSTDPVALSYVLRATGPVTLPTGDVLTADNAVQLLLSDVYARYADPAAQDAFFASATAAVFTALTDGRADPRALLDALVAASNEHRLLVWSSVDGEQQVLAPTQLGAALASEPGEGPLVGVYLNDGTGAKMGYYLRQAVAVTSSCPQQDAGPRDIRVDVTLTSTAPADAGQTLPDYVTGGGVFGVPEGTIETTVHVHGPVGANVVNLTRDGAATNFLPNFEQEHPLASTTVNLQPGSTTTLSVWFTTNSDAPTPSSVRSTPGVAPTTWTTDISACR